MLGPHAHVLATHDLIEMISVNHLVVIQTRGLFDTVVSAFDHLNRMQEPYLQLSEHPFWSAMSDEDKMESIITFFVPWLIRFVLGWDRVSATKNVKWIHFEDVIAEPNQITNEIFSHYSLVCDELKSPPAGDINYNIGRSGRGQQLLSTTQQEKIADIVELLTKHWRDYRCSPYSSITL